MSLSKSVARKLPGGRAIWKERNDAQERADRLSNELEAERRTTAALQKEIEELKNPPKPFKTVSLMGREMKIFGRRGDSYFDNLDEAHTNDFLAFAASRLDRNNAVAFDVGSNIGLIASTLSGACREVHSFEPSPTTQPFLMQTLAANNASNVTVNQVAVAAEKGELRFFDDYNSTSASHVITGDTLGRISEVVVPVTTIDAYAGEKKIDRLDFMKIDIEGFEIDALRGGENTIKKFKPSVLVEFNSFTMIGFRNVNPRELLDYLRGLFPHLYKWEGGQPVELKTDGDALGFIHNNLVHHGCVDDLLGTYSPV
ncbi:FkbM family methyltransferase [Agrobacterium sp. 22-214-1]